MYRISILKENIDKDSIDLEKLIENLVLCDYTKLNNSTNNNDKVTLKTPSTNNLYRNTNTINNNINNNTNEIESLFTFKFNNLNAMKTTESN